ncbi:MAG: bile acid:sodium symporter family protein, partial [Flavobacteriaceae bacterium]|nr:bile acid:sodium symporter family protein [Flavobacteriaceae bacterium]
ELFKLVTIILGIPLVLGMLVRYRFESFALKMSRILKPISILVFILIVVLAFLKNTDVFKNYAHHVIWIGILHNFIALSLGYLVAKGFRLSKPEIKTITLETGIQNSGLGLLLIFAFFNGLGGMAILAAFWGIWHIISGLGLAIWWSRK